MRLEALGLRVCAGRRVVLEGVGVAFGAGECVGVIGPNGAGKSSLLRTLALLSPPAAGSVTLDGLASERMPLSERARSIAFLSQSAAVHWPMRVEQVVALGRLPHTAAGAAENAVAVERALAAASVAHLRTRPVDTLSGGERARVLIARALAVEAPVLIADEPNAALDPYHQLGVMELLRDQARRGRAVLVALHDLSLATRFCTRLILVADGGIAAEGPPGEVLADMHLASAFGISAERGVRDGELYVLPWQRQDGIKGEGA